MRVEWALDALADLDRFAAFLREHHPSIASRVARSLIEKADMLADHPDLGRPLMGRDSCRQIVMRTFNAAYVLQYRTERERVIILRVFHHREQRP